MTLTNYKFHVYVQHFITVHYHSCSIDKFRNVEGAKCHNFGRLGISYFKKEGPQSSGQLDPSKCHSRPLDSTTGGYI